jgi:hypothetical protein
MMKSLCLHAGLSRGFVEVPAPGHGCLKTGIARAVQRGSRLRSIETAMAGPDPVSP